MDGYLDLGIWVIGDGSSLSVMDYSNYAGSRPIICLNDNVKLEKQANGSYIIVE